MLLIGSKMIYKRESVYAGIVKNIKPYGAFVEIGGGVVRLSTYRRYFGIKNKITFGKTSNWAKNKYFGKIYR